MPLFDIIPALLDPADESHGDVDETVTGYCVLAVPRSLTAPHAVIVNEGFCFPKRNGAMTARSDHFRSTTSDRFGLDVQVVDPVSVRVQITLAR